ncbi:hypothetical protein Rcae01_02260 [Novipirellula caenicola]|uniref:Uncharacterized protein n=1 Tax=Novipirellula caenicola TaxID=1536901 RepID=A0ABP9VNP0_9BACT
MQNAVPKPRVVGTRVLQSYESSDSMTIRTCDRGMHQAAGEPGFAEIRSETLQILC